MMKEEIKFLHVDMDVVVSEKRVREWLKSINRESDIKLIDKDYVNYVECTYNEGHGCIASVIFKKKESELE